MLRTSLQGTMDVLLARTKIKSEMRLDVTTIRSVKNNPVKFSYNVDEAVSRLLGKEKSEGYMEPIRAIEEAFEDIRAHQIAVLAGMQTALKSILKRFDPETLEKRLQKLSPISASIPIHKQAKLWDQFQQLYEDIEREAQDDFNRLFGDAFSSAYEEQIQKLKSQNN
jgi:type VI secretion system FHA domain protein